MTLATLRMEVWVISGRKGVRKALSKCNTCERFSNESCAPIMGDLPSARVTPSYPFSRSGVDYMPAHLQSALPKPVDVEP